MVSLPQPKAHLHGLDDERADVTTAESNDVVLAWNARPFFTKDIHRMLEGNVVDRADEGRTEDEADDLSDESVPVERVVVTVGACDPTGKFSSRTDDTDDHELGEPSVISEKANVGEKERAEETAEDDAGPELCWQ